MRLLVYLLHHPQGQGRSRSASIDSLVEQAAGVAAEGGKEIVITGGEYR